MGKNDAKQSNETRWSDGDLDRLARSFMETGNSFAEDDAAVVEYDTMDPEYKDFLKKTLAKGVLEPFMESSVFAMAQAEIASKLAANAATIMQGFIIRSEPDEDFDNLLAVSLSWATELMDKALEAVSFDFSEEGNG